LPWMGEKPRPPPPNQVRRDRSGATWLFSISSPVMGFQSASPSVGEKPKSAFDGEDVRHVPGGLYAHHVAMQEWIVDHRGDVGLHLEPPQPQEGLGLDGLDDPSSWFGMDGIPLVGSGRHCQRHGQEDGEDETNDTTARAGLERAHAHLPRPPGERGTAAPSETWVSGVPQSLHPASMPCGPRPGLTRALRVLHAFRVEVLRTATRAHPRSGVPRRDRYSAS
jgi:hypothetical protein